MTRPSGGETAPTDEDIETLIARSQTLLDELRNTFAEIRTLLHGDGLAEG